MSDQEKHNPQHSDRQKPAPTEQKPIIQSNQPVQQKPPVPIAQPNRRSQLGRQAYARRESGNWGAERGAGRE